MAVDQFQEAVAYQKGNAEYHYQLGKAYLSQGAITDAVDEFKEAISLDPSHISATLELGHYFGGVKLFDKAIAKFKRVIDMQPDHPAANLELGKLYLANEDYSSANAQFKNCLPLILEVANSFIILDLPFSKLHNQNLHWTTSKRQSKWILIYPMQTIIVRKSIKLKGKWKQQLTSYSKP